jgi:DeoR family transcriptional regulator, suf operon transcriptional repressor
MCAPSANRWEEKGNHGRPADLYHSTHEGEALFTQAIGDLSLELLGYIEEEDPNLVCRVFERRQQRHVEQVRDQLEGKNLDEKVAALAEILDAEGIWPSSTSFLMRPIG